jgi:hypothetical protein
MTLRRTTWLRIVFCTAVIALTANLVRLLMGPLGSIAHATVVTPVPYTVVLKESVMDKDGKTTGIYVQTYALRADGSTMFKTSGPVGQRNEGTLRLIDLATKLHIEVRDLWDLKSTRTNPEARRLRDPNQQCTIPGGILENVLGEETIAGLRGIKLGKGERTSWFALEHGCAPLGERWVWKDGAVTEKVLVSLTPGEPELLAFYVPDSFKEVPPSQIATREMPSAHAAHPMAMNKEEAARQKAAIQRLDSYYLAHRPPSVTQR